MPPYNMVRFDARFEGQPNVDAGQFGGVDGMKRFLYKLGINSKDNPIMVEYQGLVDTLGLYYMGEVKRQFAAKHGRTGETASTMAGEFGFGEDFMRYSVTMRGNVGFVLNELPPHFIDAQGIAVEDPMTGPWNGRTQNFYSPFGPVGGGIYWYQGGSESFSPDKSWYEDSIPALAEKARTGMATLGAQVAILWEKGGAR